MTPWIQNKVACPAQNTAYSWPCFFFFKMLNFFFFLKISCQCYCKWYIQFPLGHFHFRAGETINFWSDEKLSPPVSWRTAGNDGSRSRSAALALKICNTSSSCSVVSLIYASMHITTETNSIMKFCVTADAAAAARSCKKGREGGKMRRKSSGPAEAPRAHRGSIASRTLRWIWLKKKKNLSSISSISCLR